ALMTGDYRLAGQMMESDLFHESYRATLIPNYADIKSNARKLGAYGTVISGAGPTMISLVPDKEGPAIAKSMQSLFPDDEVDVSRIDQHGLTINNCTSLYKHPIVYRCFRFFMFLLNKGSKTIINTLSLHNKTPQYLL